MHNTRLPSGTMLKMVKDGTHSTMQPRLRPMRQRYSPTRIDMLSVAVYDCGMDTHHPPRSSAGRGGLFRV